MEMIRFLTFSPQFLLLAIVTFEEARRADRDNERYPTPEPEPTLPAIGSDRDLQLTGSLKRAPSLKSVQNLKRERLETGDSELEATMQYMDIDEEAKTGADYD